MTQSPGVSAVSRISMPVLFYKKWSQMHVRESLRRGGISSYSLCLFVCTLKGNIQFVKISFAEQKASAVSVYRTESEHISLSQGY